MLRPRSRLRINLAVLIALTVAVVSAAIFTSVSLANADQSLPTPPPANMTAADWPVNERGQTYGSSALAATYEDEPDLIQAAATNGKVGYLSRDEMRAVDGSHVKTPEEALAWQAAHGNETHVLPVYALDGVTVIGHFVIEPGHAYMIQDGEAIDQDGNVFQIHDGSFVNGQGETVQVGAP